MSCLKTLTIYEEKSRPIMLHVKGIGDPLYSMMFLMAEGNKTMWQDLSRRGPLLTFSRHPDISKAKQPQVAYRYSLIYKSRRLRPYEL